MQTVFLPKSNEVEGRRGPDVDRGGETVFSIVKMLWRRHPKLVVLENVHGMAMKSKHAFAAPRPSAFILRGERRAAHGAMIPWGLELIPHYMTRWLRVTARQCGLSQARKRIYFVRLRRDVGGYGLLETVISKLKHLTCLRSGAHLFQHLA